MRCLSVFFCPHPALSNFGRRTTASFPCYCLLIALSVALELNVIRPRASLRSSHSGLVVLFQEIPLLDFPEDDLAAHPRYHPPPFCCLERFNFVVHFLIVPKFPPHLLPRGTRLLHDLATLAFLPRLLLPTHRRAVRVLLLNGFCCFWVADGAFPPWQGGRLPLLLLHFSSVAF